MLEIETLKIEKIDYEGKKAARGSISDFCREANASGAVDDLVRSNLRCKKAIREHFSIKPVLYDRWNELSDYGYAKKGVQVFIDEPYGFVLCAEDEITPTAPIAVVSFELENLFHYRPVRDNYPCLFPRIVQMQGLTRPRNQEDELDRNFSKKVVTAFSLEDFFVDLVATYAIANGYPAIGIVPAHSNKNKEYPGYEEERVIKRYDQTAERRGFSKERTYGLYVLDLRSAQLPTEL